MLKLSNCSFIPFKAFRAKHFGKCMHFVFHGYISLPFPVVEFLKMNCACSECFRFVIVALKIWTEFPMLQILSAEIWSSATHKLTWFGTYEIPSKASRPQGQTKSVLSCRNFSHELWNRKWKKMWQRKTNAGIFHEVVYISFRFLF